MCTALVNTDGRHEAEGTSVTGRAVPGASIWRPAVLAAGVGFVLLAPVAGVLLHQERSNSARFNVWPLLELLAYLLLVLPWLGPLVLRLLGVPRPWVVGLLGEVLMLPIYLAFYRSGGVNHAWWVYGLQAALAYGLAAMGSALAGRSSAQPT
ncbi:hypothetical protein AB0M46_09645 [Dactylosporangium sp. NPDC051485]|uniref:hypothetical protein n=1 Tax=Dactylosporangium sp. NPDC051485 TaxID=3154846 RepID=UPI0034180497